MVKSRQHSASAGVEQKLAFAEQLNNVSRETLGLYKDLLIKWQQKINLISNNTIESIDQRHIQDSLQLTKFISTKTKTIIDIGSGAGLPGIPLAVVTGIKTYLIESDLRKKIFLEEVIRNLKIDAIAINKRLEETILPTIFEPVVITARALSSIKNIFEMLHSLLEKNNITRYRLILPKGKNVSRETLEAEVYWEFNAVYEKSETDSEASIVIIDNFKRKVL